MKNEIDIFTQKLNLMIRKIRILGFFLIFTTFFVASQEVKGPIGHKNNNKFKQLYEEFSTPNRYRTASGSPGKDYYQQKVDYTMNIILDDENSKLYGDENIKFLFDHTRSLIEIIEEEYSDVTSLTEPLQVETAEFEDTEKNLNEEIKPYGENVFYAGSRERNN